MIADFFAGKTAAKRSVSICKAYRELIKVAGCQFDCIAPGDYIAISGIARLGTRHRIGNRYTERRDFTVVDDQRMSCAYPCPSARRTKQVHPETWPARQFGVLVCEAQYWPIQ